MNRQQRRNAAKINKKLQHSDQVASKSLEQVALHSIIKKAATQYSACVALTMHDKLGFGRKRTQRFMKQVADLFDSIDKGYLDLNDVLETVENELGIVMKK